MKDEPTTMENAPEMPKAYEPQAVEDAIYEAWEKSGLFNPDNLPGDRKEPFTVMMPPPNRTGRLHIGHALGIAVQDAMTRFARMRGKKALWLPGTDHAAIATQVKVEGMLIKEGIENPRATLGREEFLKRVVAYAEESGVNIVQQTRKMGASCDWSREAYTFDEPRNRAVNEMFRMMLEDGIVEKGNRIVNWDPQFQTTLSDDEVDTKETKAKFLTFTYDADFPIVISTTRPETKFGDTAVAVHPDDERYKDFVGKTFEPVFCGKKLSVTVVADEAVDPEFGSGALGVTPAHSLIDADMAERHGLPTVSVIGLDGRMNGNVPDGFKGLTVKETREKVEKMLDEAGLLRKVEEIDQNLPVAQRGGAPVEQLPMPQWFVRVNKPFTLRQDTLGKWKKGERATLKELMIAAVETGGVEVLPERFRKVYFHWVDNLRDWCISRQIWFGHRVPMWYELDADAHEAWEKDPEAYAPTLRSLDVTPVFSETKPDGDRWVQDPDTLDTWFSSGTWTFSTLGWPEKTEDLATFHPTQMLETAYDIIFFWVARMIMMSTYALGEVPFTTTYLHGLVRDEQGRKMSKSLENIIDPLDVAEKYGTDAVRLSLILGNAPGNDSRLSDEKIGYFRNFTNKLWNISRFARMTAGAMTVPTSRPEPGTLADRWILSRFDDVAKRVTADHESYNLSRAGETLRDFTWGELADWYLEIAKIEGGKTEMLSYLLYGTIRLWHPFMPFVTEKVYEDAFGSAGMPTDPSSAASAKEGGDFLMVAPWPEAGERDDAVEKEFQIVRDVVTSVRNIRATYKVEPGKRIPVTIYGNSETPTLEAHASVLEGLAKIEGLTIVESGPVLPQSASGVVGSIQVYVPLGGMVDLAAEKEKLVKEREDAEKYRTALKKKLGNEEFTARAPEQVVAAERQKLTDTDERIAKLDEQIASLG